MYTEAHTRTRAQMRRAAGCSVAVLGTVVLRGDHQTSALAGTSVDGLQDVNELLLVVHGPIDLVVVTGPQIYHHVLVPEEEHHSDRVVQLIHGVEVRDLLHVHEVDDTE